MFDPNSIQVGAFFSVREIGSPNTLIRIAERTEDRVTVFDFSAQMRRAMYVEDFADKPPYVTEYSLLSIEKARATLKHIARQAEARADKLTAEITGLKQLVETCKSTLEIIS